MKKKPLFSVLALVLAALNLGTIRRAEDPIRDTQTNPILYEQKKEEEKDGKKGALLYTVKYNPSDKFLVAPPVASQGSQTPSGKTEETGAAVTGWWEEASPVKQDETLPSSQGGPEAKATLADQEAVTPSEPAPAESPTENPQLSGAESENAAPPSDAPDEYWW